MRLVANITIRDEAEFIEANIDYHLALGFYGIVVLDICSSDGTRDKLKKYKNDLRVDITETDDQGKDGTFDWGQHMLELSKQVFRADFVARFDADEFIYAFNGCIDFESPEFEHDKLTLRRFNCIDVLSNDFALPSRMSDLDERLVISKPVKNAFQQKDDFCQFPWTFTQISPKTIARADKIKQFTNGGHDALDTDNNILAGCVSQEIVVIHFPITSYQRFLRKILNIDDFYDVLREITPEHIAYHWKRWVGIYRESGEIGIKKEYKAQLEFRQYKDLVERVEQLKFCRTD